MDRLWPLNTHLDETGELWIAGCAASALAEAYGTPLYVFDEATLRNRARAYQAALQRFYPASTQTAYAAKAYLCLAIAQLFAEEGLDLDVVSGGELYVALRAGFPPARIHFHGNNKSAEELAQALEAGVGRIVVDNFYELETLTTLVTRRGNAPGLIWLRLAPGIQPHTHAYIQTGQEDTKFGFSIATGAAEQAVVQALAAPGLTLVGLHAHIGSQIYEPETLATAATRLVEFAATMRDRHGFAPRELSPGGGWGVPMTEADPPAAIEPYVAALAKAVVRACRMHGLEPPHLVLEPGRSLVAPAAVALYRVGARKEIPGVRTYVSVDGGMADNIRPALYGARYCGLRIPAPAPERPGSRSPELRASRSRDSAARPGYVRGAARAGGEGASVADSGSNRGQAAMPGTAGHAVSNAQGSGARGSKSETVTIAGKFCESGDILIRDIKLPRLNPGDLIALPMAGAYTLAMASNYNLARRPAVVLVRDGQARLIQRRESFADLADRDLPLAQSILHFQPGFLARFWKYHALGNDYIVLDPADWPDPPDPLLVRRICDRHRGVGADGVLWGPIPPSRGATAPDTAGEGFCYGLRLFNPDGGEFEKSGNGLRIFARYLWDRGLPADPDFAIDTPVGRVTAHVLDAVGSRISMEMGRLSFDSQVIPVAGPPREVIEEAVEVGGRRVRITAVTIGNPHCVVFLGGQPTETAEASGDLGSLAVESLSPALAHQWGPQLEHLPLYPDRTNVQFAQVMDRHTLRIEIWERGAGYTLASGTSSCAAAGAAIRTGRCTSPVTVRMPGGQMFVEVADDWSVRLTGTVEPVCVGEMRMGLTPET